MNDLKNVRLCEMCKQPMINGEGPAGLLFCFRCIKKINDAKKKNIGGTNAEK